jgi:hypothetical protein
MNRKERTQLPLGLYRIEWRNSAGVSLAAVGMTHDGDRWLAPCNWVRPVDDNDPQTLSYAWRDVQTISLIQAA